MRGNVFQIFSNLWIYVWEPHRCRSPRFQGHLGKVCDLREDHVVCSLRKSKSHVRLGEYFVMVMMAVAANSPEIRCTLKWQHEFLLLLTVSRLQFPLEPVSYVVLGAGTVKGSGARLQQKQQKQQNLIVTKFENMFYVFYCIRFVLQLKGAEAYSVNSASPIPHYNI